MSAHGTQEADILLSFLQCAWVKKLGADVCLDYRSPTFNEDLVKATEGYVDV